MNKTIYHFINNIDYAEVCFSSFDKDFLQELMYDVFLNDVIWEFYYSTKGNESFEEVKRIFNKIWEDMLDYYDLYISITESEII